MEKAGKLRTKRRGAMPRRKDKSLACGEMRELAESGGLENR